MSSTPEWLTYEGGGYYINFRDVTSKNDGDACISCITREAIKDISGPVCIDVGADAGWWSLFCKEYNPSSIIHAFEPNPAQITRLQQYTSDTFTFYNKAVSNINSTIRIDFNHSNSHSRDNSGEIVETTTLNFILDRVPQVQIIKIDTEGHDITIVRSLEKYFNIINTIVFEFTVYWYGSNKNECLQNSLDILELVNKDYPYIYILCRHSSLRAFQICDIDNAMPIIMALYNNHLQVDIACSKQQVTSLEILDENELLCDLSLIW